jgi:nitrogen fixation protein FixH
MEYAIALFSIVICIKVIQVINANSSWSFGRKTAEYNAIATALKHLSGGVRND